jgi:hypothetical protein
MMPDDEQVQAGVALVISAADEERDKLPFDLETGRGDRALGSVAFDLGRGDKAAAEVFEFELADERNAA